MLKSWGPFRFVVPEEKGESVAQSIKSRDLIGCVDDHGLRIVIGAFTRQLDFD